MNQQVNLDLLKRFDPLALSPLVEDSDYGYFLAKRVMDITLATLALIVLFPLIAVIAILVVLDSPGSVLFTQKRVGSKRWRRGGFTYWQQALFNCYKFRTMVREADPTVHQAYIKAYINNDKKSLLALQGKDTGVKKLVDDPRVTRVGKILRKFSLDEIPQFWNVVTGDMTLVGPRPSIPYELEEFRSWHYQRFEAFPGLTGLWQVTARSSADFDEMVRLDIEYIQKQSIWLDIKILFKTPLVVLSCKGAH